MPTTKTFDEFKERADYSLLHSLTPDPQATADGHDHRPREVFSGHYVPVSPTAIPNSEYIAHSEALFNELGLSQELARDEKFSRLFSGDISVAQDPMRPVGWATGYALSIYGTEYNQQCPFGTGNGYGDGRRFQCLKASSRANAGRCNSKAGVEPHIVAGQMAAPCFAPVCESF